MPERTPPSLSTTQGKQGSLLDENTTTWENFQTWGVGVWPHLYLQLKMDERERPWRRKMGLSWTTSQLRDQIFFSCQNHPFQKRINDSWSYLISLSTIFRFVTPLLAKLKKPNGEEIGEGKVNRANNIMMIITIIMMIINIIVNRWGGGEQSHGNSWHKHFWGESSCHSLEYWTNIFSLYSHLWFFNRWK